MKGRRLPFGSPEKQRDKTPEVTAPQEAQPQEVLDGETRLKEDSGDPSTPDVSMGNGNTASLSSSSRPRRKASVGSFQDETESLESTMERSVPNGTTPPTHKKEERGRRSRAASLEAPTLTAVLPRDASAEEQEDTTAAAAPVVVRVIVDGKVFVPTRGISNTKNRSMKTYVGNDGNQYHCQVCREFGDVVCCDG